MKTNEENSLCCSLKRTISLSSFDAKIRTTSGQSNDWPYIISAEMQAQYLWIQRFSIFVFIRNSLSHKVTQLSILSVRMALDVSLINKKLLICRVVCGSDAAVAKN